MANVSQLAHLGQIIRTARKAKKLSLEDAADQAGIKPSYLWIIEKAYVNPGRKPTVPSDEVLASIAKTLDIPPRELHTALGRAPSGELAASFVREKLAGYGNVHLTPDEMDALIGDIEVLGASLVGSRVERAQKQEQPA